MNTIETPPHSLTRGEKNKLEFARAQKVGIIQEIFENNRIIRFFEKQLNDAKSQHRNYRIEELTAKINKLQKIRFRLIHERQHLDDIIDKIERKKQELQIVKTAKKSIEVA
jgi:hypothetical protein